MNSWFRILSLTALLGVCLYLCYLLASPFLREIAAAAVLAVVISPLHRLLLRRLRRPNLAAALATLAVILIILVPVFLVGFALSGEIAHLREIIRSRTAGAGLMSYLGGIFDTTSDWASARLHLPADQLKEEILARLNTVASWMIRGIGTAVNRAGSFLLSSLLSCLLLFFLLRGGHRIMDALENALEMRPEHWAELKRRMSDTIMANVIGVVAVCAAQGLLTGIGLWLAGVPSPIFWGLIAGVCAVIPIVGSAVIWLPAAAILLAGGHWKAALFLAIWCVVLVGSVDNLVRPLIIRGRVEVNNWLVLFSLLGGMQAFGFIGIFLGPLTVSVTREVFLMLRHERHNLLAAGQHQPGS